MKETPIIMSSNHPRLVLDGPKTQTRRVIKPQPMQANDGLWDWTRKGKWLGAVGSTQSLNGSLMNTMASSCPYGQAGSRLWVQETWAIIKANDNVSISDMCQHSGLFYKADNPDSAVIGKWRPSIFMPRWASRILLEITEVRVERVQDITEEDALAEGIIRQTDTGNNIFWYEVSGQYHGNTQAVDAVKSFADLWDSLNAKRGYGFEVNPWVWVISFKVVK